MDDHKTLLNNESNIIARFGSEKVCGYNLNGRHNEFFRQMGKK